MKTCEGDFADSPPPRYPEFVYAGDEKVPPRHHPYNAPQRPVRPPAPDMNLSVNTYMAPMPPLKKPEYDRLVKLKQDVLGESKKDVVQPNETSEFPPFTQFFAPLRQPTQIDVESVKTLPVKAEKRKRVKKSK
jgi:hypothetical protein